MKHEKHGLRPLEWLKRDPYIGEMHRAGYFSYQKGLREKDICIRPNPNASWDLRISREVDKEQIPWEVNFRSLLKNHDSRPGTLGISENVLSRRTNAWIAGYGVRALEEGDYITALKSLEVVVPDALKENFFANMIISKVVHGWLGLPKR